MTPRERADRRRGLLLLAPTLAILGVVTVYPGAWVLWLSLQHRIPVFGVERFAGVSHYVFLAGDPRFWSAVWTTAVFTASSVTLELVLGVLVALALAGQRRGRHLAFSLLLLGWAMPAVVTAKLFEWLYHPAAGLGPVRPRLVDRHRPVGGLHLERRRRHGASLARRKSRLARAAPWGRYPRR